jgi:hypothetical protein
MSARPICTATSPKPTSKYNHRAALGVDDAERADALLRGAKGKRLLYRQPNEALHA